MAPWAQGLGLEWSPGQWAHNGHIMTWEWGLGREWAQMGHMWMGNGPGIMGFSKPC